jgi:hypothetical protein
MVFAAPGRQTFATPLVNESHDLAEYVPFYTFSSDVLLRTTTFPFARAGLFFRFWQVFLQEVGSCQ